MSGSLAVLTGWSHFKALSVPTNPWSWRLLGSFLDPFGLKFSCVQMCTCCLLKSSCCSPFPQPPATPRSVFPASLLLFLPPFVSQASFHATGCFLASPTYHGPLLPEPGNLPPAHPACSPLPKQQLPTPLQNVLPKPSLSLPALPCFLHFCPIPPHCCPERQLRGREGIGKQSSSRGLSGDTGVTQRIRAIHMI